MRYVLYFFPLLGFFLPKSKKVVVLQVLAMTLFYGGYKGNIDLGNYIWQYDKKWITTGYVQNFYSYVSYVFSTHHISFETYHYIITFASVALLAVVICRMTKSPAYVLAIVSFFVYAENGWQLKTMIATSVIAVALLWYKRYIYRKPFRLGFVLVYAVLIFTAIQFHFFALFFLCILFQPYVACTVRRALLLSLVILLMSRYLMHLLVTYAPPIQTYLVPCNPVVFVALVVWQLLGVYIMQYAARHGLVADKKTLFYVDGTKFLLLITPFYFYTIVTMRIYRIWLIFMAIFISTMRRKLEKFSVACFLFDAYMLCSYLFWYVFIFILQGREPIVTNALKNVLPH